MGSLRLQAVSGVKWTSTSTGIVFFIEFVRIAILAHILNPSDFGLATMVTVIVGLAQTFADAGLTNAVIQRTNVTRDELSSLYWLNVIAGALIFVIVVSLTGTIVKFYAEPRLASLVPLAALNFIIAPFGSQFGILLQRELRFKESSILEAVSAFAGVVVSVVSAMMGHGVYSIIYGSLAMSATGTLLLLRLGLKEWHPSLHFRFKDLKEYLSFGLYQLGERSVNYLSANVDYLFVGKFLGPTILGAYMLAYQLVVKPIFRINPVLAKVAFPIFSRKQDDNASLIRGYKELIRLLSLVIIPLLVGLGVVARYFIPVVYGEGWELSTSLVEILVMLGILKTISNPMGNVLLAKGRADIGFKWNVIAAGVNTVVFYFAAQMGVFQVAWSWVVLCMTYFFVGWLILYRLINLGFFQFTASFIRPALISLFMGFVVYLTRLILGKSLYDQRIMLCVLVSTGILVYVCMVWITDRKYIKEMYSLLTAKSDKIT